MSTPIETTAPPTGPTGPRTDAGKARTRINAVRHGLTAREFVCSPAEADAFTAHRDAILAHYTPAGPIETNLAHHVASSMWRLDRALAIEEGIFALSLETDPESDADTAGDALAPARAWLDQHRTLTLLTTYESRIRRALTNDKKELTHLQNLRHQSAHPAESVCSTPEIGFVPPISPNPEPVPAPAPESVCSTPPTLPATTPEIGFVPSNPPAPPAVPTSQIVVLGPKHPGWRAA